MKSLNKILRSIYIKNKDLMNGLIKPEEKSLP
ncbi:hypothetical protein LCGC14_1417020 [marine sediment metagenome]|uniref:Uncharacterized protein n=1 Tax=marine sediment metagenome TaxID=412755 RepID=A0A0F9KDT2_9ZZZZ